MILGALFLFGLPLLVIAYSYFTYYQPSLAATVVAAALAFGLFLCLPARHRADRGASHESAAGHVFDWIQQLTVRSGDVQSAFFGISWFRWYGQRYGGVLRVN
jgi:hypothetical protein